MCKNATEVENKEKECNCGGKCDNNCKCNNQETETGFSKEETDLLLNSKVIEHEKTGLRSEIITDEVMSVDGVELSNLDKNVPYSIRLLIQRKDLPEKLTNRDVRAFTSLTLHFDVDGKDESLMLITEFARIVAKGSGFIVVDVLASVALGDYLKYLSPYVGEKPTKIRPTSCEVAGVDVAETAQLI